MNPSTQMYDLINSSIQKFSENKFDGKLFSSFILTGGNTLLKSFSDNTKRTLEDIGKTYNLSSKLLNFPTERVRLNSVWIGASIFSSIDSNNLFFISKKDLEEFGDSIIDRKLL